MNNLNINKIINSALREDAASSDITTNRLISKTARCEAKIIARQAGVVCGLFLAKKVFLKLDKSARFTSSFKDGNAVQKGQVIARIKGKTRALLTAERTALNFLSYLSAIATKTSRFIKAVKPYKTSILDTRKTTPSLRALERYAVKCAGGMNHRLNLSAMAMVKDNHKAALNGHQSLTDVIKNLKQSTAKKIEVEVDTLTELKQTLEARPDIILLDNMTPSQITKAVKLTKKRYPKKRPLLEASGGINLKNIKAIAKSGVDRISIGGLTHSRQAIDFSMEVTRCI